MNKIQIIFLSSSEFGLPTLRKLAEDGRFSISAVITTPDKPKGRRLKTEMSLIKKEAKNLGIQVLEISDFKDTKWEKEIKKQKPDVMVMASFGKIIPENILKIPKGGIFNIHPSLLPKFRGPSPIQSAILTGEKETGVTIILTDNQMDHGPILKMSGVRCQVSDVGYKKLHDKLAELSGDIIGDVIIDWVAGKIKPIPQDDSQATYTKKIKKENGLIDWNESAEIIGRKIRAFEAWPVCYFFLNPDNKNLRVQILEAEIVQNYNSKFGGVSFKLRKEFFEIDGELAARTGQGILKIIKLKPEGKNIISGEEFIRGYLEK